MREGKRKLVDFFLLFLLTLSLSLSKTTTTLITPTNTEMLSASARRGGSLLLFSRPALFAATVASPSLDASLIAGASPAAAAGVFSPSLASNAGHGHHQTFLASSSFHSSARSDAGGAYSGSGGGSSSPSSAFTQGRPSTFVNYGFR